MKSQVAIVVFQTSLNVVLKVNSVVSMKYGEIFYVYVKFRKSKNGLFMSCYIGGSSCSF